MRCQALLRHASGLDVPATEGPRRAARRHLLMGRRVNPLPSGIWSDAFAAACPPRPRITVSQWADRNRVIPRGTSPEPGQWRTARAPYLREPMDAISDPAVERVVCMLASQ